MGGRLGLGVATALSLLSAGGLYAQGFAPAQAPQAFSSTAYAGPAGNAAYGPAGYGSPAAAPPIVQGAGPFGTYPEPQFTPPQLNQQSIIPAAFQLGDEHVSSSPAGTSVYCSMPGCGGSNDQSDDFVETPWEELICRVIRNVDIRLDYINWGISRPQTTLIGAQPGPGVLQPIFNDFGPVQSNPTDVFPVLNSNFNQVGQARAYDTTGISLSENSGFQATFILPMTYGSIETTAFILSKAGSAPNPGGLPAGIPGVDQSFAAIPVNVGGQASQTVALFSQGFDQSYTSFLYGAETNIYFNAIWPKEYGLLLKPMIGFRYLGLDEHFNVVASNPGVAASTINSTTINNIYGPQVGLRLELATQWFTIGADPRFTFGINQFAASVASSDPTVGYSQDHEIETRWAPVGACDCYLKIPIQEHFRLYVAYNLIGTTNISRPQQQINYDITASGQNDTHLNLGNSGVLIQGYEVGCEFNF
jgi:Putative beta barrel porin-7 (BBP7)